MCPLLLLCWALIPTSVSCLNVVAIGGSGRVGASTIKQLFGFAQDEGISGIDVTVGGRSRERFEEARNRTPELGRCGFVEVALDDKESLCDAIRGADLVIHTAGPFQGRTIPQVLDAALECGVAYVDVCDETELVRDVKGPKYDGRAREVGVPCVVSAGIWPGISAMMAREAEDRLGSSLVDAEYSFFTAGERGRGVGQRHGAVLNFEQFILTT